MDCGECETKDAEKSGTGKRQLAAEIILIALLLWAVVGSVVFHCRHPWATEWECFVNMHNAMTFQQMTKEELRG